MRRSLFLLAVPLAVSLVALVARADTGVGEYWDKTFSESQACFADGGCTGSVPVFNADGGASAGASTAKVDAFRVLLCAPTGQTLTGTGSLKAFFCDHFTQLCYENPQLATTVNPDGGTQCFTAADFRAGFISTETWDTVEFVPQSVGVTPPDGGSLLERIYRHIDRVN